MPNCTRCGGNGSVYENVEVQCSSCGGTGYVWPDKNTRCTWCHGSGRKQEGRNITCPECHGSGRSDTNSGEGGGGSGCMVALIWIILIGIVLAF